MSTVTVRFWGVTGVAFGKAFVVELERTSTVGTILDRVIPLIKDSGTDMDIDFGTGAVLVMKNGNLVDPSKGLDDQVEDGDLISIMPPAGGG